MEQLQLRRVAHAAVAAVKLLESNSNTSGINATILTDINTIDTTKHNIVNTAHISSNSTTHKALNIGSCSSSNSNCNENMTNDKVYSNSANNVNDDLLFSSQQSSLDNTSNPDKLKLNLFCNNKKQVLYIKRRLSDSQATKSNLFKTDNEDPHSVKSFTMESLSTVQQQQYNPKNLTEQPKTSLSLSIDDNLSSLKSKTPLGFRSISKSVSADSLSNSKQIACFSRFNSESSNVGLKSVANCSDTLSKQLVDIPSLPENDAHLTRKCKSGDLINTSNICADARCASSKLTLKNKLETLIAHNAYLVKTNRNLSRQNAKLKKEKQLQEDSFHTVFNIDQMEVMRKKSTRGWNWSNETINTALKLKISCGIAGYEELIKQHYPLPSLRTLQRRLADAARTDDRDLPFNLSVNPNNTPTHKTSPRGNLLQSSNISSNSQIANNYSDDEVQISAHSSKNICDEKANVTLCRVNTAGYDDAISQDKIVLPVEMQELFENTTEDDFSAAINNLESAPLQCLEAELLCEDLQSVEAPLSSSLPSSLLDMDKERMKKDITSQLIHTHQNNQSLEHFPSNLIPNNPPLHFASLPCTIHNQFSSHLKEIPIHSRIVPNEVESNPPPRKDVFKTNYSEGCEGSRPLLPLEPLLMSQSSLQTLQTHIQPPNYRSLSMSSENIVSSEPPRKIVIRTRSTRALSEIMEPSTGHLSPTQHRLNTPSDATSKLEEILANPTLESNNSNQLQYDKYDQLFGNPYPRKFNQKDSLFQSAGDSLFESLNIESSQFQISSLSSMNFLSNFSLPTSPSMLTDDAIGSQVSDQLIDSSSVQGKSDKFLLDNLTLDNSLNGDDTNLT